MSIVKLDEEEKSSQVIKDKVFEEFSGNVLKSPGTVNIMSDGDISRAQVPLPKFLASTFRLKS